MNTQGFLPSQFALQDLYITFGDFKKFAKPLDDVFVGFAINRWCGYANFQAIVMNANNFIIRRFRLEQAVKN